MCVAVSSGHRHSSYVDKYERITLMRGYRHHKVGPLGLHHTPRVIGRSPVSLTTIANFKLTLIKSPHFPAVIHGYDCSQWLKMESVVAEFVGVDECSYFWETDFPRYGTTEDPLVLALWYNVLANGQKMNISSQR